MKWIKKMIKRAEAEVKKIIEIIKKRIGDIW